MELKTQTELLISKKNHFQAFQGEQQIVLIAMPINYENLQ